jgi:hypothetical protein
MANFLDTSSDTERRIGEYATRLFRIESHIRRGERRAARAQLNGMLDELDALNQELELPLETIVVGAQLGFFSGGSLVRGRVPGALIGAAAGWLFGQHSHQAHRRLILELVQRVAELFVALEEADRRAMAEAVEKQS